MLVPHGEDEADAPVLDNDLTGTEQHSVFLLCSQSGVDIWMWVLPIGITLRKQNTAEEQFASSLAVINKIKLNLDVSS